MYELPGKRPPNADCLLIVADKIAKLKIRLFEIWLKARLSYDMQDMQAFAGYDAEVIKVTKLISKAEKLYSELSALPEEHNDSATLGPRPAV